MNKKVLTLSAVMASLLFGAHAHAADTRIGVTFYWRKGLKLWRLTWSTRQLPVR